MPRIQKTSSPATHSREEWQELIESAKDTRQRLGEVYKRVDAKVDADPLRAVAWASLAGFVLGGGLFSRLTLRVAGVAARMALRVGGAGLLARGLLELGPLVERRPPVEVGKTE